MMITKIYYLKDINNRIWCCGYYNGEAWRVFNANPDINNWFNWEGNPLLSGFFAGRNYILVNNFKEKPNVSN